MISYKQILIVVWVSYYCVIVVKDLKPNQNIYVMCITYCCHLCLSTEYLLKRNSNNICCNMWNHVLQITKGNKLVDMFVSSQQGSPASHYRISHHRLPRGRCINVFNACHRYIIEIKLHLTCWTYTIFSSHFTLHAVNN